MSDEQAAPQLELFGARTGNCLRVSVALETSGIDYVAHSLDLRRAEQRETEHLARNPEGQVPTLVDSTASGAPLILSQSNAILFHLADMAPGILLPTSRTARARALERFFFFLTDVIGPSHGSFALRVKGLPVGPEILDGRAQAALLRSERFLEASPFMTGDSFGLADIAALTIAMAYETTLDWSAAPHLQRWYLETMGLPAVERGLHVFDPRS